jgi:hypothetical protein
VSLAPGIVPTIVLAMFLVVLMVTPVTTIIVLAVLPAIAMLIPVAMTIVLTMPQAIPVIMPVAMAIVPVRQSVFVLKPVVPAVVFRVMFSVAAGRPPWSMAGSMPGVLHIMIITVTRSIRMRSISLNGGNAAQRQACGKQQGLKQCAGFHESDSFSGLSHVAVTQSRWFG